MGTPGENTSEVIRLKNIPIQFLHICLFTSNVDICTDGTKAMMIKTIDTLAQINIVTTNLSKSYCTLYCHSFKTNTQENKKKYFDSIKVIKEYHN